MQHLQMHMHASRCGSEGVDLPSGRISRRLQEIGSAGLGILPAVALAATLSLTLPVAQSAFHDAVVAAAKPSGKATPRSAAARKRQIERDLARARSRIIPTRATADRAPKDAPPPPANPKRDGKPLTLAEKKAAVLAAPPDVLQRIGRHVMVGYYASHQLTPLLERGAIGGVFVTSRNARRRNKVVLGKELAEFRKSADAAGQKAFWLATDQEGGSVSRLSPPLPYQPSLRNLLRTVKPDQRDTTVKAFADKQAKALAEIGINLNFAPVADLNHNVRAPGDRFTRIRHRAVADDPAIVTAVVRTYCDALMQANVYCTLKHFPGLGRVTADTHVTSARLKTPSDVLETTDWVPFRDVIGGTPAFVMVGHLHLDALDPARPASTSPAVIQQLLREKWKFDGVVVTDDLAMGAIKRRFPGGMAAAAVQSINAGADIALIGSDGDEVYDVLHALILAHEKGELDTNRLTASDARLLKAAAAFRPNSPSASVGQPAAGPSQTTTARQ